MASSSSITGLATSIAENSAKVEHYLQSNGLPMPSFLPDGPSNMAMESKDIENARVSAVGAAMELLDLLQGPLSCLRPSDFDHRLIRLLNKKMNAVSLEAIYRWDMPKHVPLDGEISFTELAAQVKMREPNVRRIIRFVIVWHRIFREPRPGFVAHSAASRLLVTDESAFDMLGMMFDEGTCDAMKKYETEDMNQTGYALAHCPGETMWQHYKTHPTRGKRFASSMKAMASNEGMSPSSLVSDYPWSSLPPNSTIVDMGGSQGHISRAIASSNPHLNFVVQDLPDIIEKLERPNNNETSESDENEKRIEFMVHDFLTPQPRRAQVYLLRQILHDWPDSYVLKILRNLVPVMTPGAKVVVNDRLMPAPGKIPVMKERQIRFYDMVMLSLFNAREREEGDWAALFREADARFQDVKVWTPAGSTLSIIEATWVE
ncbi:MAG: hypothetical protein Q9227_008148 [Pyrenula ochraceoflavens]